MTQHTPHPNEQPSVRNQAENAALQARDIVADKISITQGFQEHNAYRCPRGRGGCGGRVEKLQRVWLTESKNNVPRSDLGLTVAPPRPPVLEAQMPVEPDQFSPPPPDPPDLTGEQERFDQMLSNRGMSIAAKIAFVGIPVLCTLGVALHQESPNRDNPAPVVTAITVGCVVLVFLGLVWFKIASVSITSERNRLFETLRSDYESRLNAYEREAKGNREAYEVALERFQNEQRRFDTEFSIYKELLQMWKDSWHCRTCAKNWRDIEIDRVDIND
jgi:hypothetical protein